MADKFNQVKAWLKAHNWYQCELTGKYRNKFQDKDIE